MKRTHAVAFFAGVIFALGLGISGMANPQKVRAFLDVAGGSSWDPSLAFVMLGAIFVHLYFARRAARGGLPRFAARNHLPDATAIDARLIGGAALFGIGWGMSGFCPGPALISVVTLAPATLAFGASMIAGMFLFARTVGAARPKA